MKLLNTTATQPKTIPWGAALIVLATLAAYWPVFAAGFIWDDDAYVTNNPLLTAPDGLARIWCSAHSQSQYFPLVFTTLRLECDLWGLNPIGYHVVNVGLHLINALLVLALLRRLALPGAWLAAAIFALHPVQVETVAWVTELKNTESTMFYLLALFAWLNFCAGKGRWFYALTVLFHLLALFAKTTACTLPAVMLLVLWLKNEPVDRRRMLQTLPFLLLGFGLGLVSVWWEKHLGNYAPNYHLLGGPLDRLLLATHALWFYAGKIFWPANLTFSYPHWQIYAGDWRQYIWLAGCVAVAAALWFGRRKWGRGPVAALFFFVAVLSPMVGFIPLYTFLFSYVADHYQYFACLGLIVFGVGLARKFFDASQADRRLQAALAGLLLLVLAALTSAQCRVYQTQEKLWADTLRKNPRSWLAAVHLGRICAEQNQAEAAEQFYLAGLAINPDEEAIRYNFGNLLARLGRFDEAMNQYAAALKADPASAETHNNLGFVLNKLHRTDEAIAEYEQAIHCQPGLADAYYNLGNALSSQHKMEGAVAAYQNALRLKPDSDLYRKRLQALGVTAN